MEAEDTLNRIFRTARTMKPSDVTRFPYYYGYEVTIGADGKPKVKDVEQSGRRAPLVDTAVNDQLDPGSK